MKKINKKQIVDELGVNIKIKFADQTLTLSLGELPPPKGGGFLLTQKSLKVFEFGQFLPEYF